MKGFLTFEILDERQKENFADVFDWQENFKRLQCAAHRKTARLNLSTSKKGSSVSVGVCCDEFFRQIVEKKSLTNV